MAPMVEELDAEVPIHRQNPIAYLVHLMQHGPLLGRERQRDHRTSVGQGLRTRYAGQRYRQQARHGGHEIGEFLGIFQCLRTPMQRLPQPGNRLLVLAVFHGIRLYQSVDKGALL
ncbi:MAG: hypothetical protein AW09_001203 [Candidatus Accumulibacter phosphatis]|uniref:Uncharacterized protein n=1 Tax=Candidatus Accumulibacter phosphatis TaxID=327160 RepID=A0A080LZS2_9PROT|nr:MAG: hypothetical protein AW09_001203 [Candidatus Accumulibacter phosphatis]